MMVEQEQETVDFSDLLADLNPAQLDAVTSPLSNMLIFAGAGSGKTKVLVTRIIYMMLVHNVYPSSIFAVTFTNKAANVLRERVYKYAKNLNINSMWVGTFHGLCNKFLRIHYKLANLPYGFTIIDPSDQLNIVKRILKENSFENSILKPKDFVSYIDRTKGIGKRPYDEHHYELVNGDYNLWLQNEVYRQYENLCNISGSVDFNELILRTIEILEKNEVLRLSVKKSFREIFVDEFQDTNDLQMKLLRLLKGEHAHITAVGDDDQSIYSWRGANLQNILNFKDLFNDVKIVKLEQNYRSTQHILNLANSIINNNEGRFSKQLWTQSDLGDKVTMFAAEDPKDEAQFVVNSIISICERYGDRYADCAILYRNNHLSLAFETELRSRDLNYSMIGGHKFYDRQEIKDVLGYMRILNNPADDQAFLRVVNEPPRKIGNKTLTTLYQIAKDQGTSLFNAAEYACNNRLVPAVAMKGLASFSLTITSLLEEIESLSLSKSIEAIIEKSGLGEYYQAIELKERDVGHSRTANMEELVNSTTSYVFEDDSEHFGRDALAIYLQSISLETDLDQDLSDQNTVKLMTIHGAKGLEFKNVFIVGFESGIIPSPRLDFNNDARSLQLLEEERRLCYVAITRAMRRCFITFAKSRQVYGMHTESDLSPFAEEFDPTCYQFVRRDFCLSLDFKKDSLPIKIKKAKVKVKEAPKANTFNPLKEENKGFLNIIKIPTQIPNLSKGMKIRHKIFGIGEIVNIDGIGKAMRAHIDFDKYGIKVILPAFCELEIMGKH